MIKGLRRRILNKLAYRYWMKDKTQSSEENWKLAIKLLSWLEKRYKIKKRD